MAITELFEQAVKDSKTLAERPGNDVLLKLYSLYKQATEGDVNVDPPINPFDFVSKAKYEAWAELQGKSTEDSMQDYVNLVNSLKS